MAAIAHRNADRYVERPDRDHFLFLIFGADQGMIFERSRKLLASIVKAPAHSQNIIDLTGDAIAADPLALADEAHSIGLFDGPSRVIRIALGGKSILPALELIERSPPSATNIVILAGDLKRDAAIRKWVERQGFAAAIECSADDARDVQRLLDAELNQANLAIEPEAREILAESLGDDRLSTRSEIEKLLLYARDQQTVTVQHVSELLLDATAVNLDALLSAAFTGDTERIIELTNKVSFDDIDVNRLFAAALRYALANHRARAEVENGASMDEGVQTLLRLINGYKRKSEVSNELAHSRLAKTTEFIAAIYTAAKEVRQRNILADDRFSRLTLAMARSSRSTQRSKK